VTLGMGSRSSPWPALALRDYSLCVHSEGRLAKDRVEDVGKPHVITFPF